MNSKVLNTLEYNKIIDQLTDQAASFMGKHLCQSLVPSDDIDIIRQMQQETQDALSRICRKGLLSFSGVKDVRSSLKRLEVGGTLGIGELLSICSLLENAARAKSYARREDDDVRRDSLDDRFDLLAPLSPLSHEIRRCIISEEEINDDASPDLRHIRRMIKNTNDKIHSQLNSFVGGSARTWLQDPVITMRNGRYCIPVKAEYKGQIPGMIHDQSSTGSTLFVEPMSVVKLNNEIREFELKEQAEIERILAQLSELAASDMDLISDNLHLLAELDFIFARASLARLQNASLPVFNTEGYFYIKQARHPLIDKQSVVPIDIRLGKEFDLLIVTGPNTGGKTVSLKTAGLLTLMGQSGLHIPAFDHSYLCVFKEVYADIGDEQSIEQSLSTFSSHMTNIVSILQYANKDSLVLLDELGAGTDPTEGAALAIAILSYLHQQGTRTMATTHYSELKIFALSTPGVENASCEFDVETLRPTYRLLIGIPGKSNAFAISSKLGLPEFIIEKAKEQIGQKEESFEDILTHLEQNRVTIEQERLEIERYKQEVSALNSRLKEKYEKLDLRKEKIIDDAREEAHKILRDAKEYADQTMKIFNKAGKENLSAKDLERERGNLRSKMSDMEKNMGLKQPSPAEKSNLTAKDISIGDAVKVLSMNVNGTVSSLPNSKGMLFVQMGILRSQVHLSDLRLIAEPVAAGSALHRTGTGKIKMSKSASVKTEINLLGKTVDEAIAELDKYLDDAYLSHLNSVRIIHGKGTGALRKGVHNYLKRLKYVENYHLAEFGEGDAGVTIVTFK